VSDKEEWPIETRAYEKPADGEPDADRPFFMDLWSKSYRRSRWAGTIPNNLFADIFRVTVEGLEKRGLKILLAHVPGKPNDLMGFVAYELKDGDLPHVAFCGVKDPYRKGRVATKLLEATVGRAFRYSFRTEHSKFFMGKWTVSFAPEMTRRKDL
jgi:hypothetical protein